MKYLLIPFFVLCSISGFSQDDSARIKSRIIDTAAILKSMDMELSLLEEAMQENTSYFNINLNLGNQLYSKSNLSLNSQQSTINAMTFKPGVGYYHKSGLSLSGVAYKNLSVSNAGFYQYSISPAYDYGGIGKFSGGVSYTKYFTKSKDTIADFASPYDNEFFGYIHLKNGGIEPGLTLGVATGKYTSIFRGRVAGPLGTQVFVIDSQKTKQADFSATVSLQHDFEWTHVLDKNDGLSFTPTLMLNAGSSKITAISHSNKLVSNIVAKRPNSRFKIDNAGFQLYSLGLSLNVLYEVGIFYFQPETYFDYYLLQSDKKFTSLFSITAGINL